jgi:hypothetical protein
LDRTPIPRTVLPPIAMLIAELSPSIIGLIAIAAGGLLIELVRELWDRWGFVDCPRCGTRVQRSVRECPHCGLDFPQ